MLTLLAALLAAFGGAAAEPPDARPAPPIELATEPTPLLEPEPLGFDATTVARLRDVVRSAPVEVPRLLDQAAARGRALGAPLSAVLLAFVALILTTIALQSRLNAMAEARAAAASMPLPPALRPWLVAAARVAAATLPPLALWLLHDVLVRRTGFTGPGFLLIAILLRAWVRYALVTSALRELVLRPLISIAPEHGRYLNAIGHGVALYALVLYSLIEVGATAGVPDDMLALLTAILDLSLIVLLTAFAMRKHAVLALLPDLPNRFYRAFRSGLAHGYPLVLALTTATALFAWAGYVRLANFVWVRSWALAGVFLAAVLVVHVTRQVLRHLLLATDPAPDAAARLYRSTMRLLDYAVVLIAGNVAIDLVEARRPLAATFGATVYALADRQVSITMLLQAALVVGAFCLVGAVLRDVLSLRLYPLLRLDEGIAHAVNTFITYAMGVVGVLFSLEYVGLGLGAITVFAGALGIGLGFGMQSLANNLASGLTLIFGRALRRGDWINVGDTFGRVEEVGMRATRVVTRDSVEYLVPNSEFVAGTIVNWTGSSPFVREHVPLSVAHGSDPEGVIAVLVEVASRVAEVERTPPPEVWFTGLRGNALDFELLVWIDLRSVSRQKMRSELYRAVFRELEARSIELASDPRDVHVRSVAPDVLDAVVRAAGPMRTTEPEALGQTVRAPLTRRARSSIRGPST